jgi:hypothetical protein
MYREYPIEQLARNTNTRFQIGFARSHYSPVPPDPAQAA